MGERKLEIENFQMHINALLSMFTNSLQLNEDAEDRVRSGMQDILDTKDRTILQLQKERNHIQGLLDEKTDQYEELKQASEQLKQSFESEKQELQLTIDQMRQTILDKNNLITLLNSQKEELQKQIGGYTDQDRQLREANSEIMKKNQEIQSLTNEIAINKQLYEQEIRRQEKQAELQEEKYQFDLKKALLEKEKELQLSWEQEKMEYTRKLELYQMKYVTALERLEQIAANKDQGDT
ncbi:MAG TPA: hypothetical protein IAC33_09790 [Candidatus Fimousia stercorigallinarum]|nr:hypothetical protein [Candidatus Fimousia stercorigallinarum]